MQCLYLWKLNVIASRIRVPLIFQSRHKHHALVGFHEPQCHLGFISLKQELGFKPSLSAEGISNFSDSKIRVNLVKLIKNLQPTILLPFSLFDIS